MPFVTEEIWHTIPHDGKSIMLAGFPRDLPVDGNAEKLMGYVMDTVSNIRSIRGELNIPPSVELEAHIRTKNGSVLEIIRQNESTVRKLARLTSLAIGKDVAKPRGAASAVTPNFEIFIPIKGVLDFSSEIDRLTKELEKVNETISFLDRKLLNEDFLSNAPSHIVDKEKKRYAEGIEKREKIEENIERMKSLSGGKT